MKSRNFTRQLFKKLFSFILLTSILSGAFSVSAQTTRRKSQPKTIQPVSAPKQPCNGGWSGVVTYKKILKDSLESDEPGIRKNIDRIKHKTSRDYDYAGRAFVDGKDAKNTLVNTKVKFTDDDLNWGEERVWDSCGSRENGHWFIIESTDDRQTAARTSGSAESFNLRVDEAGGTYGFSLQFPEAKGTYKREQHVKRSGHCQPKNNEPYDKSDNEATTVGGETVLVEEQKIDPQNPDVLSGTKIWGDDGSDKVRTFVYQTTWRFMRCPPKLLIADLKFEHPKFPDENNWQEIVEPAGTIDGNLVKIKATVVNLSSETKYAEIYFKESYEGDQYNGANVEMPLKDSSVSVRLEAGEEKEIETFWNTDGYAWFDDGRPRLVQRVKAEIWEANKFKDAMIKNLKVAPKPIIFVPGVWTKPKDFELYQNLLTMTHSYGWKTFQVIDTSGQGTIAGEGTVKPTKGNKSVYDNADNLTTYVNNVRTASNAWHVDMLAHSTGGLVARLYVHKQMETVFGSRPVIKHLLMLGVPNDGVPCADTMKTNDAFRNDLQTAKELMPEEIKIFNQYVTNRKGTRFSALVGNSFPILCASPEWNDGFVSVESAKYGVTDYAFTKAMQPDLISTKTFNDFIKPHVVTGPRGTYPLPVISEKGGNDGRNETGKLLNLFKNNYAAALFSASRLANNVEQQNSPNFTGDTFFQISAR